ncbi:MAG TPA: sigma-70 family RNA polymerase sigma factor [Actinomycetota bacterium]
MEGRPLEDADLVDRAQHGDVGAYEELVRRHQRAAIRIAYVTTGIADEAEDAAQEGFVKAYHALPRFRPGAPFRPWILRIVANEARNRRRSAGRRARLALRLAEDRRSGDAAPSPEQAVLAVEDRRELVAALSALREADRLVIAYRYLIGLSEADTASALGVARGTVKSRLSRALDRLRAELPAELREAVGRMGAADG